MPTPDDDEDDTSRLSLEDWFFLSINGVMIGVPDAGMNELVVCVVRLIESESE